MKYERKKKKERFYSHRLFLEFSSRFTGEQLRPLTHAPREQLIRFEDPDHDADHHHCKDRYVDDPTYHQGIIMEQQCA